jgi:BirA family biotin operon repressor/biotin-[acetyl-CoA-carboxylase] ligase
VDLRKLAGILVETSGEMQGPSVAVVGVGVNYRLGDRVLERIDQPVSDVSRCAPSLPSRSELLARLLGALAHGLDEFERHGFAASRDAWRGMHAYQGRRVRVLPPREPPFDAEVFDVAADGALVVLREDGRTVNLSSAEISLRGK